MENLQQGDNGSLPPLNTRRVPRLPKAVLVAYSLSGDWGSQQGTFVNPTARLQHHLPYTDEEAVRPIPVRFRRQNHWFGSIDFSTKQPILVRFSPVFTGFGSVQADSVRFNTAGVPAQDMARNSRKAPINKVRANNHLDGGRNLS